MAYILLFIIYVVVLVKCLSEPASFTSMEADVLALVVTIASIPVVLGLLTVIRSIRASDRSLRSILRVLVHLMLFIGILPPSLVACGGVPKLSALKSPPRLYPAYEIDDHQPIEGLLPRPESFKDSRARYVVLRKTIYAQFELLDDMRGHFRYTPKGDLVGIDRVDYHLSDGQNTSQILSVQFTLKK